MFSGSNNAYDRFRATIKIWMPQLSTLDGTDFNSDRATIAQIQNEIERSKPSVRLQFLGGTPLTVIEEKKGYADEGDVFEAMKQKQTAAGKAPVTAATYAYNKQAHRKITS